MLYVESPQVEGFPARTIRLMALPGTEGLESKKGLAYAKLFAQQQVFAAKQARLFEQVSSGDAKAIDAILKQKEESIEETGANGKVKRKRAPKDPDAPKRPKTGYQLFMIDKLSTVRAENEGLKMKELMPILATEWKELSEKDKKRYQKKALTEKGHYESALKTYKEQGASLASGTTAAASPAVSKGAPSGVRAGLDSEETDSGSSVDETNKEDHVPRSVGKSHGKAAQDDEDSDSSGEHKKKKKRHHKHKHHKKDRKKEE